MSSYCQHGVYDANRCVDCDPLSPTEIELHKVRSENQRMMEWLERIEREQGWTNLRQFIRDIKEGTGDTHDDDTAFRAGFDLARMMMLENVERMRDEL